MLTAPGSVMLVSREVKLSLGMARLGLLTEPWSPGLSTIGVRPARRRSEKLPL